MHERQLGLYTALLADMLRIAHLAMPFGTQPRESRPRQLQLPRHHVDQVCAQGRSAMGVRAAHAKVHAPAQTNAAPVRYVRCVDEMRVQRCSAVRGATLAS